ncbi:P-loop NTPase fold protein [Alteromonas sp. S015]|uniref:P-loop NTPase fold protein n=1 Tax=Alteromonas sp. S015 TaxID=3117401 RepID=UPI002FDF733E
MSHKSAEPPELIILLKTVISGLLIFLALRIGYSSGVSLIPFVTSLNPTLVLLVISILLVIPFAYSVRRGAIRDSFLLLQSKRFDLLIFLAIGTLIGVNLSSFVKPIYQFIETVDKIWVLLGISMVLTAMTPVVLRKGRRENSARKDTPLAIDEEVSTEEQDVLDVAEHAKAFAESVIEAGKVSGLVFGVDGPWGVGKTSFINIATQLWKEKEEFIVVRFEPLRYANEEDLTDRLISEVTMEIQQSVFAPEFQRVANRYSKLLKGKAELSFFGIKLTFQPGSEKVEDLIADIDAVLERIDRRLIIVIDDLDRLDAKAINNVLFATRRTLKLANASYVLSYDTELLVGEDSNIVNSREFLEKFVTIKTSLFVNSAALVEFLKNGWQSESSQLTFVPAEVLEKLGELLSKLASLLSGDMAPQYLPLVGNLRKVKRIINAMVSMRLERTRLAETDFDPGDLINLVLLHLNYPGVFRKIYSEETSGNRGLFSLRSDSVKNDSFINHEDFENYLTSLEEHLPSAYFLVQELFDVNRLEHGSPSNIDVETRRSRACFNSDYDRNLERYLDLIVRFTKPEPQETYVFYKRNFEKLKGGESIASILSSAEFNSVDSHDKFWRVVTNNCFELEKRQVDEVIDYLIDHLPEYPSISLNDRPLRIRAVYTLIRILDRVGWISSDSNKRNNSEENVEEIAWRIFGEKTYEKNSLIDRLSEKVRGVIGWYDLVLFRLTCCGDRAGQLYEISKALIYNQDKTARTTGVVKGLTILEMRKLSQVIAKKFQTEIIEQKVNFYEEVAKLTFDDLKGKFLKENEIENADELIHREKSLIISFVMYQLANTKQPDGSGIGFGYYDFDGEKDNNGISDVINNYVFNFCFAPDVEEKNVQYFLDHCLSHLSNSFFSYGGENKYVPLKNEIPGGFSTDFLVNYWRKNKGVVKEFAKRNGDRQVITPNYSATYSDDLESVFSVLDELVNEHSELNQKKLDSDKDS